jgi:hypothetical protein
MWILALLAWVPVGTSLVLGVIYLAVGDASSVVKITGTVIFLVAVYLQFFSPYVLVGLLVQTGLALCLEFWRRMNAPRRA